MKWRDQKGTSLIEVTIAVLMLVGMIVTVTSAGIVSARTNKKNEYKTYAARFAQAEIEAVTDLPFDELTERTDADFIGFGYNWGEASVVEDLASVSGTRAARMSAHTVELSNEMTSVMLYPESHMTDGTFSAYIKALPASSGDWSVGLVFHYHDPMNHYYYGYDASGLSVVKVENGAETTLYAELGAYAKDTWYKLKVVTASDVIRVYMNDVLVTTESDDTFLNGHVGVVGMNEAHANVDDVYTSSSVRTGTEDFESQQVGEYPAEFLAIAPVIPDADARLTIAKEGTGDDLWRITASVRWTEDGATKQMDVATLKSVWVYEP